MNRTDQQPYTTAVGVSPSRAEVPLWVTACTLFDPPPVSAADKVVTAVTYLMATTVRVRGDLAVKLSPSRLALLCGFERPEKSKWLTDYLQKIGFLQIVDGGVNPKTGRRQARRDAKGRPVENEFLVFPEPPAHYCGPRTLAEIDALIAEDIAEAELAHERSANTGKKRGKPRTIPIRRRELFDETAGQPILPTGGMDKAHPPHGGDGANISAGQPILPTGGAYLIDRRSSISEGEIEDRSIEPVPGVAAEPPATGHEERIVAEVRRLVRRLPWKAWADRQKVGYELNERDARLVMEPICAAIAASRLTIEQAEKIGPAALSEATRSARPAGYVADAFGRHLDTWLERITVVLPEDDPLPLPDLQAPGKAATSAADAPDEPGEGVGAGEAPGTREKRSQPVLRAVEPEERPASPEEIAAILRPAGNQG